MRSLILVNPLEGLDEWAALSDGSVALLRTHDYHVDIVQPDGKITSGAKLPYDWKPLSDKDKQRLVDSLQRKLDAMIDSAMQSGDMIQMRNLMVTTVVRYSEGMGAFLPPVEARPSQPARKIPPDNMKGMPEIKFVPITESGDYAPPFHAGAMKADLDRHVWILPATSRESKAGELVYDVVNNRGELIERVRMPVGRSLAGFGAGGVIYLMSRDGERGWALERVRRRA